MGTVAIACGKTEFGWKLWGNTWRIYSEIDFWLQTGFARTIIRVREIEGHYLRLVKKPWSYNQTQGSSW
jgi:hypothetical protein